MPLKTSIARCPPLKTVRGVSRAIRPRSKRLAQQILNPLREAELELARHLEILVEKDKIRAALEDDTPAAYQNEVKAYYEAVGKGK